MLVYRIPEGFVPKLSTHGNSKEIKPFHPTLPSTIGKIKEKCGSKGPQEILNLLSYDVGGICGSTEHGQLPRNVKQIRNFKSNTKKCLSNTTVADHIFSIMQEAYTQDPGNAFIRDIKTAPEPAIILANDSQLKDLIRFCTSPSHFGILTVDPTFCLGNFDVTPITYRHLLLTSVHMLCLAL